MLFFNMFNNRFDNLLIAPIKKMLSIAIKQKMLQALNYWI